MKTVYNIAKTELQILFYSPVAWLILVIFTFQSGILFSELYGGLVRSQSIGWRLYNATLNTFGGLRGLFTIVQTYLYLYIPLLTMGVMSRELGSGSIKLLYSSPLTNTQIILGKYLSIMLYGLVLVALLSVFCLFAIFTIERVDIRVIISGLMGIYLLLCAYGAIGLFMSSLTSYTVVAAMGTLAVFSLLSYIKGVGQDVEFVRDITYWLAISGRSDAFISGMITTEDVLYFLVVIGMFLAFSILKLSAGRSRSSGIVNAAKYGGVFLVAILIGYFSSMPRFKAYWDVTRTKMNTLTKSSQEVMKKVPAGVTINTYVNMLDPNYYMALPAYYKTDMERFAQYIRFNPDIKLKHSYYYHDAKNENLDKQYPKLNAEQRLDTLNKILNWKFKIASYNEISKETDLSGEEYRFVRELRSDNGRRTFLRIFDDNMVMPSETEITAAFKRLTMELPMVGFLTGHGERSSSAQNDRGYKMITREKTFRYALINQGFDFKEVTLDKEISQDVRILVIAEVKKSLSPQEMEYLNRYIAKGGNIIIAGEPGRELYMNQLTESMGVEFLPGTLVKPTEKFAPDLQLLTPTKEGLDFSYHLKNMLRQEHVLAMPSACALKVSMDKGFEVKTLFTSDSLTGWNELQTKNLLDDSVSYNPAAGEEMKPFPVVVALSRKMNNKEQKILITGDADWLSNGELGMSRKDVKAANYSLISAGFFWLSDNEVPIDMRRDTPPDRKLKIGKKGWDISNIALKWIFPISLVTLGLIIWVRRKRR